MEELINRLKHFNRFLLLEQHIQPIPKEPINHCRSQQLMNQKKGNKLGQEDELPDERENARKERFRVGCRFELQTKP